MWTPENRPKYDRSKLRYPRRAGPRRARRGSRGTARSRSARRRLPPHRGWTRPPGRRGVPAATVLPSAPRAPAGGARARALPGCGASGRRRRGRSRAKRRRPGFAAGCPARRTARPRSTTCRRRPARRAPDPRTWRARGQCLFRPGPAAVGAGMASRFCDPEPPREPLPRVLGLGRPVPGHGQPPSHSFSLDQRRRVCWPLTAMASALRCPTSTTSRLPRVTPV